MTPATTERSDADRLRNDVVDELTSKGWLTTPEVEEVMRRVPRHAFTPGASLEEAYNAYGAVVTKKDEHGVSISSVSAPQIQGMMLEQAAVKPGMNVLEIGSGGLNAAYLAELVGESGTVTTVDIDPEVTERATRLLVENGYPQVNVVLADAAEDFPGRGPYDRIIVTAGAWDILPGWREELTDGGRLVVPLRMRGLTRTIDFKRVGDHLESSSARVCGFVPMQGAAAHQEELLLVAGTDEIGLRFDDGLPADPSQLDNAVLTVREEMWTSVTVGLQEHVDTLQMYLATVLDGFCVMAVDPDLDTGLVAPSNRYFSLATVEGDSFAYLTTRRTEDDEHVEYGVHAFGPTRQKLAQTVTEHVRTWAKEHRGGPGPKISVFPAGTPDDQLPGERVIDKVHSRVTLSWHSVETTVES
ncbi:methyltransferase, FxLD system [Streptomyces luomodiensis]|uniref:Protein-L-isoaspartate O-methyltransferase n=1 Tax=Streptomyces luomodiensis TaxID=3026192 RepID=A0ABY9UWZ9_9ACTN|nr:methyltransferase, FxLD system [Streptomyces sp. SCA4-21]WNE96390.1 methyltransferase, FxLD system [Streptomyces sp. SCA4-21]